MDENRIITLQPMEMEVKVSPGMSPIPTPIKNNVQRLIAQLRAEGKTDKQIRKFFSRTYKVDLIYV